MEKGIRLRPRDALLHIKGTDRPRCRSQKRLAMGSLASPKKPEVIGQRNDSKWSAVGRNSRFCRDTPGSSFGAIPDALAV